MTSPAPADRVVAISDQARPLSLARFAQYVLIALGMLALAILAWRLSDVFILVFGAIVVAAVLRALSDPLARLTGLPAQLALAIVAIAILGLLVLGGMLIGDRLAAEMDRLITAVPEAWTRLRAWLEQFRIGRAMLEGLGTLSIGGTSVPARLASVATFTFSGLVDAALVLVIGVFIAADPDLYRRGLLKLVPRGARHQAREAVGAVAHALRRWLLAQGIAMLSIGLLTGIGLWILGVPMALGLGILAGLMAFIPYIGPFVSAGPGILLAFSIDPATALYALMLYIGVQQVEGNVITPLAQRWAAATPPALALVSVIIFGLLFGLPGVLFATPLMIAVVALVDTLYVDSEINNGTGAKTAPAAPAVAPAPAPPPA